MAWSREETIGRDEMRRIQLGKLQKKVGYVYERNAVYRKLLDDAGGRPGDIGSLDDLRRLPFTTKQHIRDQYPFGLFCASMEDIVEFHATSGTTGKPVVVPYTRNDIELWTEVMARACTGAGITKNDIVQNIYGYGLFTGGLGTHYGAIRVGATVLPMSGGNSQRQIMLMQDLGSTVVTATPSFLMHLHEVWEQMGVDFR
ncbi:MAG: paaK-4, partial [Actinobacteria bacterium]|nr:paaK-4 [Actinomycetota bacterium]